MEIKKLDRKKESKKNFVNVLQTINKYCSKNRKKISEEYLGSCQIAMTELFCKNSQLLKDSNYFCRKNFIIDV